MNYLQVFDNFYFWLAGLPAVDTLERSALLSLRAELTLPALGLVPELVKAPGANPGAGQVCRLHAELIPDKPTEDSMILELHPIPQWALRFIELQAARDANCFGLDCWSESGQVTDAARVYLGLSAESELLQVEAFIEQLLELDGPVFEPARIDIFAWLAQNA